MHIVNEPGAVAWLLSDRRYAVAVACGTVDGIGVPLNVLWYLGGHPVAELAALGVKRISTGSQLCRAARRAAVDLALELADASRGTR
ncbi:isocitrate lyase/phosphoenolpyruvate mutase family protein [Saccharomonospora cyanea]|uniref:Uncharacterized protein n=1 Tax=Saccharomonospora cyanea NA-134 TaxID=882082 RepID=H5XQ36_9PSEU|nr:isocitrate lyase/phosphoenolpyruvate mutase family protein [Saccharomonospora cyanea]EHR63302.1 hypothetical protein SaccyDRAFT_4492 [Saccharomonospora cyanea NA-134]